MKNGIILFIVTLVVLVAFLPSYTQMQDIREKNLAYEQEIKDLKAQIAASKVEQRLLIEDPDYIEKIAREKMGLVKTGEVIYRMEEETAP